ncbi:MAG: hypothetical protein HGA76_00255 [Candidatus Firestonebacteria bacterium]|nr:hypothetical protein [Candidatus Firestonebacteria bacterium]
MFKLKKFASLMMFLALTSPTGAFAAGILNDTGLAFTGTIDGYSRYIWRGFTVESKPVLQPGLTLSGYGANVNLWGSMPLRGNSETAPSDEIDLTVGYAFEFASLGFSAGYLAYTYPYADNLATHEASVGVALGKFLPFDLNLTYYFGLENQEGGNESYGSVDAAKTFTLGSAPDFTLALHYGWLRNYDFGAGLGNGGDAMISLKAALSLGEKVSLTPTLAYVYPFGDVADENLGAQSPTFFGGLSFGFGN